MDDGDAAGLIAFAAGVVFHQRVWPAEKAFKFLQDMSLVNRELGKKKGPALE